MKSANSTAISIIMGIFSLDLSKPIDLNIHADGAALDTVMAIVGKYVTE